MMISVKVDSQDFPADISHLRTMGDLVELIKATIDPDSIITSMALAGQPITEADWQAPLTSHAQGVLEIATGEKKQYISDRLASAEHYLFQILDEFNQASAKYGEGSSNEANTLLSTAVEDLLAFINWYLALLSVDPISFKDEIESFNVYIKDIQVICEQLVQQQMFQSWTALGETIRTKLEPELSNLKRFCESNATRNQQR
jgi:hypothetical protein